MRVRKDSLASAGRKNTCMASKYTCHTIVGRANNECGFTYSTIQQNPKAFGCPKCGGHIIVKGKMGDGTKAEMLFQFIDKLHVKPLESRLVTFLSTQPKGSSAKDIHFKINSNLSEVYPALAHLEELGLVVHTEVADEDSCRHGRLVRVYSLNTKRADVRHLLRIESRPTDARVSVASVVAPAKSRGVPYACAKPAMTEPLLS